MRRILPVFLLFIIALGVNAQSFKWKEVKTSMTSIPEDYYEGATREEAMDFLQNDFMAEGAIYGAVGEGVLNVLHWDSDWENIVDDQLSWEGIIDSDMMYYYPAGQSEGPAELVIDENSDDSFNYLFEDGDIYSKVTLNRKMTRYLEDGTTKRWHTVVLPFPMNAEQIAANFGEGANVVRLSEIDGNTFNFITSSSIVYGDFCLVQLGDLEEDLTKVEVTGEITVSPVYGRYDGDFNIVAVRERSYVDNMMSSCYMMLDNEFKYVSDEETATATQWYIESYDEDVKQLTFTIDGVATAVDKLQQTVAERTYKVLQNKQIVIRRGNKTYNAMGVEL